MKAQGSRVLIFSQMSRVLDILEDYSVMRNYQYCRIDGSTAHEDRIAAIDDYSKEGSEKFLFLLTTRAGGLGINLTSADIVVLFDSDWNPQADLQAMDRAHRIGQTKQVMVFRFVTENAIEEKVLERAAQKLRLDQLVIQQGRAQQPVKNAASKDELLTMIQHGAEKVFQSQGGIGAGADLSEDALDAVLRKGEERTAELNAKYEKLGLDDLQKFTSDSAYEWNGETFQPRKKDIGLTWINPSKRERKEQSYSMDKYYRQALMTGNRQESKKERMPRPPKQIVIHDYQFFPAELQELQDKETAWYRKENNLKAPLNEGTEEDLESRVADQELAQQEIDEAEPLTEEEKAEKERLINIGFPEWNKRDFQQFLNGSAKYGRQNYEGIAEEVDGKDAEQIAKYAKVFWKKYKSLENWQKHIGVVEEGEARVRLSEEKKRLLAKKIGMYRMPLQQMTIKYTVSTTNKKVYTEEEDRFLLVMLNKHGIEGDDIYDKIRDEIRESPLFRFDWFFLSRTPQEIGRRCNTLISTVMRELGDPDMKKGKRVLEEEESEEEDELPAKKKAKNGVKNKQLDTVKGGGSASTSRATSVVSNSSGPGKSKGKGKKK
jgi:SWI/SNF-related matrix-associated actin-dependent regulator of chromatin subfamily A member 5